MDETPQLPSFEVRRSRTLEIAAACLPTIISKVERRSDAAWQDQLDSCAEQAVDVALHLERLVILSEARADSATVEAHDIVPDTSVADILRYFEGIREQRTEVRRRTREGRAES